MKKLIIKYSDENDLIFVNSIEQGIIHASQQKGAGIAVRSPEYITLKILERKAIIAKTIDGEWAGFCYIESWGHSKFVANSGLIVREEFRGIGLAKAIKEKALHLSIKLFPGAKIFGITTSLAVMKINSDMGYRPVTISELTDDDDFWKDCQSCAYFDILVRTKRTHCLCTAMLYDPGKFSSKYKKSINFQDEAITFQQKS